MRRDDDSRRRRTVTLETKQAQLESVRSAIAAIEAGAQTVVVLGRTYQRAMYKDLCARERELERDVTQLQRGGSRMRLARPTAR